MKEQNKDLLETLIQDRLTKSMSDDENAEQYFNEAMKAIDRQLEIDKRESEMQQEIVKHKYDTERELSKNEFALNMEKMKQDYDKEKEISKQNFEISREEKRQSFESVRDDKNIKCEMDKKAMDKEIELAKIKSQQNSNRAEKAIKLIEIGATLVAAPLIGLKCNTIFAKTICEFEKDYMFTTTAGKTLSKLFKL